MAIQLDGTNGISTSGNITAAGTISAGSFALTAISVTGNVTGDYFIGNGSQLTGVTATNVGVLTSLSVTGNTNSGNLITSGLISATGTLTAGNTTINGDLTVTGNASLTGNIVADRIVNGTSEIDIQVANGNANVTIGGTNNVVVFATTGQYTTGVASVSGNITGGNLLTGGLISATGAVTSSANVTGANILTGGLISSTGNITGGNLSATNITGTLATASQTNITSVGTLTSLNSGAISSSGNVTGANILTGGLISATGNVTGGNINTAVVRNNSGSLTLSTGSSNLYLSPTANVVVNSTYINGVSDPVQNQDVATKYYVDTIATTGLSFHPAVLAATTTTLATTTGGTITYTQPNGAGNGVGALLTTTGSFDLIDTANVQTVGTRILVKNEGNAVFNGVYTWSNATAIVRSTDTDEYGANSAEQFSINDYFFVTSGNVNAGSAYVVDAPTGTITFGTSNIAFAQFSSSQTYTANTAAGISLNGTIINAKVDNTTTAFDGGGNISVKASAQLTTPNIGAATGTSLSVSGTVTAASTVGGVITGSSVSVTGAVTAASTVGGIITGSSTSVTGNTTAGNLLTGGLISSTGTITSVANIAGGNILTDGLISATGNLTAGNVSATNISGTLTTASQTNITSVGTLGSLSVTGNIVAGNISATDHTGTTVSVTGNVTGSYILGNGSQLTGITSTTITNDTTTNATYYPAMANTTSGSLLTAYTSDTKLTFNPSTGDLSATNFNSLSDQNKKTDVETIIEAVELLMHLRGVFFRWKDNGRRSMGMIAQEVESVIPEVVSTDENGVKSVAYGSIVGLLVEVVKDHEIRLQKLEGRA